MMNSISSRGQQKQGSSANPSPPTSKIPSPLPSPSILSSSSHSHSKHQSPEQSALLQSARAKLSEMDQEAMKKMRSTMMDYPDSSSSTKSSPASARFPPDSQEGRRELRTRRSTLSKHIGMNDIVEEHKTNIIDKGKTPIPLPHGPSVPPASNADYAIAVVGHNHVGKTTLIARALKTWGMSHPLKTQIAGGHTVTSCYSQIEPGGKLKQPWKVEFLEMNIHALGPSPTLSSVWPEGIPSVAGAIFCYDATKMETLSGISEALKILSPSGIPIVMLACKTDPDTKLEIDAHHGNSVGEPFNVGLIEVTTQTSEGKSKMRNALRWLVYKLEQRQRRQQRRQITNELMITSHHPPSSPALASATLEALSSPVDSDASSSDNKIMWHHRGGFNMTPADRDQDGMSDHRSSGSSLNWVMKGPPPRSSLEVVTTKEDQRTEMKQPEREIPKPTTEGNGVIQNERVVTQTGKTMDPPVWLSVEELLNRLFAAIASSQASDETFVQSFAMTYRRFMEPREVMQEFLDRLSEIESFDVSRDVKNWTMMKLTGALVDWVTRHPGDLQDSTTQRIFREILAFTLHHTFMAHLTGELIMVEQSLSEVVDLDKSWSVKGSSSKSSVASHPQSRSDTTAANDLMIDTDMMYEFTDLSMDKGILEDDPPDTPFSKDAHSHHQTPHRHTINSQSTRSVSTSSLPMDNDRHGIGYNHKMGSDDKIGVSSADESNFNKWSQAYNLVLNTDAKNFAIELTKMQWTLFTAIRARDLLRHDLGKETNGPVGKAIAFFNHLSRWVTTIILAHPKPKHRAKIVEKFIMIAHQLRRLNNYDSLYAVISGIRETSIHRLSITQSLITLSPTLEKDYQSHLKLMDPRGGYLHYRRALQADISNGRASIPLLTNLLGLINRLQNVRREDKRIIKREEISNEQDKKDIKDNDRKDDSNDKEESNEHSEMEQQKVEIQWDKFYKFGEILQIIPDCQVRGPIIRGEVNEGFKKLIENTNIITNEDGLWERSQLLEPSNNKNNGAGGGTVKVLKKLANFGF
ncbi:uncharacterized protein L201_004271 [Kwoniella dendrophila CBS 6074]|uniref:Uncharacterized protein n=1 Tax=Kwoniella dendrophila CBS 6074 TaxID=1295534 RepID=A0AAX4JX19_9TREE